VARVQREADGSKQYVAAPKKQRVRGCTGA
jgi:hypothetical protein